MSVPRRSEYSPQFDCDDVIGETSLRSILDNSPDAIARFDCQLRHRYVNAATGRENNRPVEDFHGKTMEELGHESEVSHLINRNLCEVFRTREEITFDCDFTGPHGQRLFQCRMAPELKPDGSFDYVICFSRDVTKERHAERALIEAEKIEAESRLHQQIAHEINNPLQALRNTMYLLKHSSSRQEMDVHVDRADEMLERVEALLRHMLEVSKVDSSPKAKAS